MKNIKGRHWVFILGFFSSMITSIWNTDIASEMLVILFFVGIGLFLKNIFNLYDC